MEGSDGVRRRNEDDGEEEVAVSFLVKVNIWRITRGVEVSDVHSREPVLS